MIDLQRHGDVFVLRFEAPENRFRPESIEDWNGALDEVEAATGPKALVTTGSGRFYSNGLDLGWLLSPEGEPHRSSYVPAVLGVMARILTFPAFTVAAINGHAFGAGAQLSLAHDRRVMRSDRGYWCMPEIDLGAPFHPGMVAIIQARLPHQSAHEVMVTGTRYTAEMAVGMRIVDRAAAESQLLGEAISMAEPFAAKASPVMRTIKAQMYPRTLEALAQGMESVPRAGIGELA